MEASVEESGGMLAEVRVNHLAWTLSVDVAASRDNPFEIDEEEIAEGLAALPEPGSSKPEELISFEEAEVPALWLL